MTTHTESNQAQRQSLQQRLDRLDAAIEREKPNLTKGSGPAQRQADDRLAHLRFERHQVAKQLQDAKE